MPEQLKQLEICYGEPITLCKLKNIFQTIVKVWVMIISVQMEKYLHATRNDLIASNDLRLKVILLKRVFQKFSKMCCIASAEVKCK